MHSISDSVISGTLHQRIVELLQDALLSVDLNHTISLVNKRFCALTGYEEEELIKKDFLATLIPASFREELLSKQKEHPTEKSWEFESYVLRKDKTSFPGLFKVTPLTDEDEQVTGSIILLFDITGSQRQLDAIKESDECHRFLMESSSEGIIIHENGVITDANQAILQMFGYAYDEIIGKTIFQFTSPSDHEAMQRVFDQKLIFQGEREMIDKLGKTLFVEINSKSFEFKGRHLRVFTLKDVTELREKKVEKQRLISTIESSPFFVAMMDSNGLRYINRSGRTWLGYEETEDISHLSIKDLLSKKSAEIVINEAMPAAIREGIWQGQSTLKRKDGTTVIASQILIAHRDEKGTVDFFSSIIEDITDRIKSEQTLIESRERLRYFMEESLEAIIIHEEGTIIHEEGTIIDYNTAACKMFGYDDDELQGKSMFSLYDTTLHREIKDGITRRQVIMEEWTGVKKDGKRFDVEVYSRPHVYKGKDVLVVSILDITVRKQTERALRNSELMLNAAVEGTHVGIWEWNLITNKMSFNETWRKILGLNETEVPEFFDQWKEGIVKEDLPEVLENLKKHIYGSSPLFHQVFRAKVKGGFIVMESRGKLVRDENKLPALIVGTAVDITERQQMEDALRKSQAHLTALLENREETIWSVDTEKRIVNFNKPFAESFKLMFGIELKKGALITEGLDPAVARIWVERYEICIKGESLQFVERFKVNGKEIFMEFTANPIFTTEDIIIGVSVMGRNITQQIEFEESLKKAKEIAEEANRTKSLFLANISHEIRTPMNGIMGFTDLLLQSKINSRQKEYLDIVHYSADSLMTLINDLLDISKIESGKLTLVNQKFDLRKLLREIIRSFKHKSDQRKLRIVSVIDKAIPKIVLGDRIRLQQILINLVGNAVKFSEHGKISVRLRVKEMFPDKFILYTEVKDEGIGIPEGKHETIFEAFNQVGDPYTSKYGGTGLGLSIAKNLVEMMGGEIGVKSELQKGSMFYFTVIMNLPA